MCLNQVIIRQAMCLNHVVTFRATWIKIKLEAAGISGVLGWFGIGGGGGGGGRGGGGAFCVSSDGLP